METASIKTPLGIATITGDENGIAKIAIAEEGLVSEVIPMVLQEAVTQLQAYFEGQRSHFDFPMNPAGTEFQQKVWKGLCEIPFGKTLSYADLAKKLGDPKVIRAAASANGKNKIAIIVPCHRIIGTDQSLVGYAWGKARKRWLLQHEFRLALGVQTLF